MIEYFGILAKASLVSSVATILLLSLFQWLSKRELNVIVFMATAVLTFGAALWMIA